MNKSYPLLDSPWRIPTLFCALSLGVFLSSCASNPNKRQARTAPALEDARSELVFLNIEEASGWVAYNCNPAGDETETETYRVVVIRQKSGEVIYDSQIPLAADLCTHGFEMAPEDPRLRKLGRSVDSEIIEPLEAYQKSLEAEASAPAPQPASVKKTAVEKEKTPEKAPMAQEASAKVPAQATVKADDSTLPIAGMEGDAVLLKLNDQKAPSVGDRFFLHTLPEVIAIPGTDEKVITSEGEVTGFVEILSIENGIARAKILSGKMPASGIAKKVVKP